MPEHFKNSGTGLKDIPSGSKTFKSDKNAENRAVRGGGSAPGFSDESDDARETPNPDHQGGPQAF